MHMRKSSQKKTSEPAIRPLNYSRLFKVAYLTASKINFENRFKKGFVYSFSKCMRKN